MAAKKSIIKNTDTGQTGNNDIDETGASEANEDLQRNKRKFEREKARPFKAPNNTITQQLLKGKTSSLLVPVMLCLAVSLHPAVNSGLSPETSGLKGGNLLLLLKPLHFNSQGFKGAVARSTRSRRPFGLGKRPAHIYA